MQKRNQPLDHALFLKPTLRLLDFFLPPRCTTCGTKVHDNGTLCADCWSSLRHITAPQCACCGLPFDFNIGDGVLCGACLKSPPQFTWARTALAYNDASRPVLLSLKHGKRLENAALMARMIQRAASDLLKDMDYIVPIPLHPTRLFKRRFNQSAYLAKHLSKISRIPINLMGLQRIKATQPQVGLSKTEREKNVRGAFKVRDHTLFDKRNIVLIDDVFTTGATVNACSKVLIKAGARKVGVVTFARPL